MCSRVILVACMALSPVLYATRACLGPTNRTLRTAARRQHRCCVAVSQCCRADLPAQWADGNRLEGGVGHRPGATACSSKTPGSRAGPDKEWLQVLGDARVADSSYRISPGCRALGRGLQLQAVGAVRGRRRAVRQIAHQRQRRRAMQPCVAQETRATAASSGRTTTAFAAATRWCCGACLHAINYRYLMEYGFQDDGCVVFRVGATGRNLQGKGMDIAHAQLLLARRRQPRRQGSQHGLPDGERRAEGRAATSWPPGQRTRCSTKARKAGPIGTPAKFTMVRVDQHPEEEHPRRELRL